MRSYNQTIPFDELYHYGVPGMKWGVRRYLTKDGTLTSSGEKKRNKLNTKVAKEYQKALWNKKGNFENRNKILNKMNKEVDESKEGKAYSELIKRREIKTSDGKVTLSYMRDDWSNPDKVINQMVKDSEIQANYRKKISEISKKYVDTFRGAALKDLGFNDTEAGRKYLDELHILDPV